MSRGAQCTGSRGGAAGGRHTTGESGEAPRLLQQLPSSEVALSGSNQFQLHNSYSTCQIWLTFLNIAWGTWMVSNMLNVNQDGQKHGNMPQKFYEEREEKIILLNLMHTL